MATRLVTWLFCAAFSTLLAIQSLSRFTFYHNRTYDLALYARQAWGLAHDNFWDPIVDAHFLGTHVSVVLWPLGWLGQRWGVVPVLLVVQALAVGLAALPLARFAARRFGDLGALCATVLWFAYPNISQVATYEFHPGTVALLPLACALDALDLRRAGYFALSCLCVLACRADFAMLTSMLALSALADRRFSRGRHDGKTTARSRSVMTATTYAVLLVSFGYLAVQYLVLRPRFLASLTSYDLHFARWGGSPLGIVTAAFRAPSLVVDHFSEPKRWLYLPMVLCPLGFLPLLAPRYLLPAVPFIAINLISTFPTTLEMYSHYLSPALPSLIVATFEGLAVLCARTEMAWLANFGVITLFGLGFSANLFGGAYPWCVRFDRSAFAADARTEQARRVVAAIAPHASVQAPDALLPHLIERAAVYRVPPPDDNADFVVLDVTHRARYDGREDLLRTIEEPLVRRWLARRDYGLVLAERDFLVFQRGREPREGPAARYLSGLPVGDYGTALTRCLSVISAWLYPQGLELELAAHAPCPADLALRIGIAQDRPRVDLLFDGLLSPALLRDERVFSWHALTHAERESIVEHGLLLGALRSSGAPPEYGDPIDQPIAVIH